MNRRVIETTGAAVLLTVSAVSAGAAPVNRPLADQLTQQFNQQELQQLQAGDAGAYVRPGAAQITTRPLGQPGTALQPAGMSPPVGPPPPEPRYLPR